MKLIEIVAQIKKEQPAIFGKMPDKRAARIIRAAFGQVGKELSATKEGVVSTPLGRFRIREVERTKDGQTTSVRHVVFRPMVPKEKAKPRVKAKAS